MDIEGALQLHESLRVWYAVDGYFADLETKDGATVAISCKGETPEEAMELLKIELLKVADLQALRIMRARYWHESQ